MAKQANGNTVTTVAQVNKATGATVTKVATLVVVDGRVQAPDDAATVAR